MKLAKSIKYFAIQLASPCHNVPGKRLQSTDGSLAANEGGKHCPFVNNDGATSTEPPHDRHLIPEHWLYLNKLRDSPVVVKPNQPLAQAHKGANA